MTIQKFLKTLALMLVGVLTLALLGGCGNSEKFAGHWIGYGKNGYPSTDCIYDITIQKNGDKNGYLVNYSNAYWKLSPSSHTPGFSIGRYNYKYEWNNYKEDNIAAIADDKNNKLTMQGPGSPYFTYIEKDKTLQLTYSTDMGEQVKIVLHPAKDNESQEFKDKTKDDLQKKIDPNTSDVSFTE